MKQSIPAILVFWTWMLMKPTIKDKSNYLKLQCLHHAVVLFMEGLSDKHNNVHF